MIPRQYYLVATFCCFLHQSTCIQWLALSRMTALATKPDLSSSSDCQFLHGSLMKQEMRFCRDHPSFMNAVTDGAKWAIAECQFQFRTRRWNCSTLNDQRLLIPKKKIKLSRLKQREKMQRTQGFVKNTTKDLSKGKRDASPVLPSDNPLTTKITPTVRSKRPRKRRRKFQRRRRKSRSSVGPFPVVPQGTRESAFVHAISSAGVAHAITRKCSQGNMDDCGCDRSVHGVTKEGFQWAGCSDNVAYGVSLSKRFVDARDMHLVRRSKKLLKKGKKKANRVARALMNLHNNEAGRKMKYVRCKEKESYNRAPNVCKAYSCGYISMCGSRCLLIEDDMRIDCKCHGVSGSCELKTCWKAMPSFREIGELLKGKFDGATEVKAEIVNGRAELQPNQQYFKRPSATDLVYLTKSPEYCNKDLKKGSLGTTGRQCNKTSNSLDGCDLLCCGRGYTTTWQKIEQRCECKFHWCCFVKCKTCTKRVQVHTCN